MPANAQAGAGDCLSDEILVELVDGRLSPEALSHAHGHAAGCGACRALLASVARGGLAAPDTPAQDKASSTPGQDAAGADPTQTLLPPQKATEPPAAAGPAAPWTPPARFDEFELGPQLGRGGMGVVYLARDTSLGRLVAVKFIATPEPGPRVRAYFETEARTIARLQHPNVVTVFRVGTVDGHPYIVSEYIVGQSLSRLPLPLPWRRTLSIGVGLARGLTAAHRQGVLHRDLKPSNALVTEDGVVKLLDFGLAEHIDLSAESTSPRASVPVGTPRYMAPELFQGASATPQSDLYSLGLTLHELCTGSLPRRTSGTALPGAEPARDELPALGPDIDPELAAIIQHCLSPDPALRPGSAELLKVALERLEQLHASTPLTEGNPYRGLAPFEAEHHALFFGRDADIRALIERLRQQPLVLVAGDSGVGKSSLCRAGVLPRVAAGALDEGREMATVTLWPGPRPLQALAAALAPRLGMKEPDVVTALTSVTGWLGPALREAHQGRRGLLIFIDQLEELLTQAEPYQAARFAHLLGELSLPSPGVRVLLAVRGDFLTSVSALPGLEEAERALYILRPMTPAGVREAIIGPARSQGVSFESEQLIQSLVESAAGGEGSLPLLQFALAELWGRRNPAHSRITREALEAMGGVAGALSRHADGVLARLTPDERRAARELLLRLVTAEGTRRELGEEELLPTRAAAPRTALRALTEGRLLHSRTEGWEARYVIAHDSLIESWGTLRNWRDRDIGLQAVRQRVEAASAEWERLSRASEALWGQRYLDEARPLDPAMLGPREQAFLAASQRAVRLRRWARYSIALLVVLALAAVYGGVRLQAHRENARFMEERLAEASEAFDAGQGLGKEARERREEVLALFDGLSPPPAGITSMEGLGNLSEEKWVRVLELHAQADLAHARASEALERALGRERGNDDARRLLSEVLHERLLLAETFHQKQPAGELLTRLERLLDEMGAAAPQYGLHAPASLEVMTEPPGARVELGRYEADARGVRNLMPFQELGTTPGVRATREPGSYLIRVTRPGHVQVALPVLLTRGGREQVRLWLPASVPDGYVYIPPGCFLQGSADPEEVRSFMRAAPLHQVCLKEGYLIGRTEVTFGDWVDYLDSQSLDAKARRILEEPSINTPRAITLRKKPGTGWVFTLHGPDNSFSTARRGEPIHYPDRDRRKLASWERLPLSGVSSQDLEGFFYWLERTERLPGARLCSEHEWEFAARGADGRLFPHGDRLQPDDANIDATYGRRPTAYGPDMVGDHEASDSPWGLSDMAGNVLELTRPVTQDLGRVVLRGGSWYYDYFSARAANRNPGDPLLRDVMIGVRVCASFPPR